MKYTLLSLCNYQSLPSCDNPNPSVIFKKIEFEKRIRILSQASKRQSERISLRTAFNAGVTSRLKGFSGQEYIGLSLLSIVALPGMIDNSFMEKIFAKLLWRGISIYECLTRDSVPKDEIRTLSLENKICKYLEMFVNVCGPQRNLVSPTVGCKFQKNHGMTHFPSQIQKYGSAENFNGAYLESHLKIFVKRPSKRTRHTHADFSHDLTIRWAEYASIEQYISSLYGSLDNDFSVRSF